ncbi:MAG: hypothetical protein R3C19_19430 [Planctomycetaceae bacterium]
MIDAAHTANGIFSLASLTTAVTIIPPSADFPIEQRRLLQLGPATTGRMGTQFVPTLVAAGAPSPSRDFFSVRALELGSYLLGSPNTGYFGHAHELKPAIRINEAMSLVTDGNDLLAAANIAVSGNRDEALIVAQAISSDFALPVATGAAAQFPAFPPAGAVVPAAAGPLPVNLRDGFAPTAQFVDDGNANTANVDVALTLNGLPLAAAVRVYNRKFVFDAREERGDGAGGIVTQAGAVAGTGTLTLLLRDPFSLRRPGIPENATSIPVDPVLRVDVVVIKQTGESRIYGNVEAVVAAAAPAALPAPVSNSFAAPPAPGQLPRRGVSNAGILGLKPPAVSQPLGLNPLDAVLSAVLQLAGESDPRDAPRLPTMARRDLLAAGLANGNWNAVLSGGRLTAEAHSADARRGSPGSPGGRETQLVGVATQNGRLAWDIARMAFRRTTQLVPRLIALAQSRWNEPAEPAAANGSFAAAVLQNIPPGCETPELGPLRQVLEANPDSLPATFDQFVDQVTGFINSALNPVINRLPSGPLKTEVENRRNQLLQALEDLKDDNTLNESTFERLFNELHREVFSSTHGRRDTQWALEGAISRARRFIYIESPGFAPTQRDYSADSPPNPPAYAVNLVERIAARLTEAPGLHVIVCTPKFPDFAPGYEPFAAHEAKERRAKLLNLPPERVVAFHPIGFPGRPSRIEATTVVVDDTWALVGSSTFRRRGLTFDGSSDVVFTDTNLRQHVSPDIARFRRDLLAAAGVSTVRHQSIRNDARFFLRATQRRRPEFSRRSGNAGRRWTRTNRPPLERCDSERTGHRTRADPSGESRRSGIRRRQRC